ncbi:MAG TPA: hypothetical protein PKV06_07435 [bacterium]|nr:hypothetical protein [bacterium]HNB56790.1 hypothetical protein [bacterium]HNH30056.1 hypothetical protein [bacterium]HNH34173.1 hypothetical protein [bacterium]
MPNEQKIEISQEFFKKIITEKLIDIDAELEQVEMDCIAQRDQINIDRLRVARAIMLDLIDAMWQKNV